MNYQNLRKEIRSVKCKFFIKVSQDRSRKQLTFKKNKWLPRSINLGCVNMFSLPFSLHLFPPKIYPNNFISHSRYYPCSNTAPYWRKKTPSYLNVSQLFFKASFMSFFKGQKQSADVREMEEQVVIEQVAIHGDVLILSHVWCCCLPPLLSPDSERMCRECRALAAH